jgi:hypothetical protein
MRSDIDTIAQCYYYFCNKTHPIFAQSSACTRIRDKGRPAAYQLRHVCCIIGVLERVVLGEEISSSRSLLREK